MEVGNGIPEPSLAERLPVAYIDITCSEHVPHGHFVGSGIAGGYDADGVVVGDAQELFGVGDGQGEAFFADFGAVGSAHCSCVECVHVVAGVFFAGAG